jgi:hypothetical protein
MTKSPVWVCSPIQPRPSNPKYFLFYASSFFLSFFLSFFQTCYSTASTNQPSQRISRPFGGGGGDSFVPFTEEVCPSDVVLTAPQTTHGSGWFYSTSVFLAAKRFFLMLLFPVLSLNPKPISKYIDYA